MARAGTSSNLLQNSETVRGSRQSKVTAAQVAPDKLMELKVLGLRPTWVLFPAVWDFGM